jgi:predicted ATPase
MAHVHLSLACWVMGEADTAVRHAEDGIALARTVDHPNSLAMALCFAAGVYQGRGDVAQCVARAEDARRLAEEQHFPLWSAMASVYLGWAGTRTGSAADGIALMRDGIARWEATGAREAIPAMQALVADALLCENRAIEASATIEQALSRAQQSGERFYEPDLHRLRASARRMQAAPDEDVERDVLVGMSLARECGARTFELRLALELGRVRVAQGRAGEGRSLVAAVRACIPEGEATVDVRDASAFLASPPGAELAVS